MAVKPNKPDEKAELYRIYVKTSAVGLELALSVGVGMLVGYFVDRHFESSPVGLIVGFVLGAAAATRRLIAFSRAYVQKNADDAGGEARPPPIREHVKPDERDKSDRRDRSGGVARRDGPDDPGQPVGRSAEGIGPTKRLVQQPKKAKDKYDVQ